MACLKIGTCSWKYPSWYGLVYSRFKGINFLKEYATKYNTVEVDQWFWSLYGQDNIRLPNISEVRTYRDAVPEDFSFSIKVPNRITLTHLYQKDKEEPLVSNSHFLSPSLFQNFLERIKPLGSCIGPLIFQFEYLNKQKMASQEFFQQQVESFITKLPSSYQYVIEIRNTNYLNLPYFEFLKCNRFIPVLLQGYWMPSVMEVHQKYASLIEEQKTIVIRLHGLIVKVLRNRRRGNGTKSSS